MIYLFAGDDAKTKIDGYEKFMRSEDGKEVFFINRNNFDQVQIESLYSGAGLFFAECAVVFSYVLEREENRDFVLEKLGLIGKSNSSFVFLEGKLNKPILDAFKKVGAKINIFELPKQKLEKFDNFLVANAFGQKDKLNLWIYYRQAVDRGVGLEELVGVLFWKIKDMLLRKNFSKFKEEQLKTLIAKLSCLLPEARANGRNAEAVLEQFLLEAF